MASSPSNEDPPVLHVVVVGFHHKKGCQVEYSYPPLIAGSPVDSHETPDEWRHLPSLALPDGAHNFMKDTIYFHLPSRDRLQKTVYGVSCYRQMDAKDLKNKTEDVTRSTVQKSVCVLSRLPLYGLIQAKLELITHAYFDERDFTKVELLEQTYTHLNSTLAEGLVDGSRVYLGLSPRELVVLFKHKIVLLFKLLLLERRVLFSGAPVQKLCSILLSVVSLFPGMLESGLQESASYSLQKQLSPTLKLANFGIDMEDYLEISYKDIPNHKLSKAKQQANSSEERKGQSQVEERSKKGDKSAVDNCDIITSDSAKSAESSSADPLGILPIENTCSEIKNDSDNKRVSECRPENVPQSKQDSHDGENKPENKVNHVLSSRQTSMSSAGEAAEHQEVIKYDSVPNPLAHTDSITQVEAVQSSNFCQRDALFSEDSPEHTPERELSYPVPPLDMSLTSSLEDRVHGKESAPVTDIDSPESIHEIDQEDCFSWEEDRLLLEIDQELHQSDEFLIQKQTASSTDQEKAATVNESKQQEPEQQQPKTQTINRTDSTLDDTDLLTETSDEDTSFRIVSKVDNSDKSVPDKEKNLSDNKVRSRESSPRHSARAIRNKLSQAFRSSSKDKQMTNSDSITPQEEEDAHTNLDQDEYGFPLAIFTKGCLCHPYLCLQYYDLLQDVNVKSFLIGATNVLFKQKRHLTDVVIDVNDCKIDISDIELRKQLQITTADLRFADILVKAVSDEENKFLEGTEWEGGDQWLRAQFRSYLLGLLAATTMSDDQLLEDFGFVFVNTWKMTRNYKVWNSSSHPAMEQVQAGSRSEWYISSHPNREQVQAGHPCQGNLSVNDIRVRFTSAMQSTERGKKINSAMVQTGKYVAQTGRAVGGALNQAKSTVSSWISNWRS